MGLLSVMAIKNRLVIATRGSRLALAQAEWVRTRIASRHPELEIEVLMVRTKGDRILDAPLAEIGGKGLFVKEIEEALLDMRADLAVHSMKDVPTLIPDGLVIGAVPSRADRRDALIARQRLGLDDLSEGARIGTASLRRAAQILGLRPDIEILPMRGNVDTRMRKLESGEVEAIVLAAAGLARLGLDHENVRLLPMDIILPAVGQGALAVEIRADDPRVAGLVEFLNDSHTEREVHAERAFLRRLEGGCQIPIAATADLEDRGMRLRGFVGSVDGRRSVRRQACRDRSDPEGLGIALAEEILAAGGAEILAEIDCSARVNI